MTRMAFIIGPETSKFLGVFIQLCSFKNYFTFVHSKTTSHLFIFINLINLVFIWCWCLIYMIFYHTAHCTATRLDNLPKLNTKFNHEDLYVVVIIFHNWHSYTYACQSFQFRFDFPIHSSFILRNLSCVMPSYLAAHSLCQNSP